jgi:prevent-host-death family protein
MSHYKEIGKREFIQHTSKYIKLVEEQGQDIVITHHNRPDLVLSKIKLNSFHDLRGSVKVKIHGDINESIFPGYDQW